MVLRQAPAAAGRIRPAFSGGADFTHSDVTCCSARGIELRRRHRPPIAQRVLWTNSTASRADADSLARRYRNAGNGSCWFGTIAWRGVEAQLTFSRIQTGAGDTCARPEDADDIYLRAASDAVE